MEQKFITETQFFSMVNIIVEKHGCQLVDIDFEKNILNVEGPSEQEYNCAMELEEALSDLIVKS